MKSLINCASVWLLAILLPSLAIADPFWSVIRADEEGADHTQVIVYKISETNQVSVLNRFQIVNPMFVNVDFDLKRFFVLGLHTPAPIQPTRKRAVEPPAHTVHYDCYILDAATGRQKGPIGVDGDIFAPLLSGDEPLLLPHYTTGTTCNASGEVRASVSLADFDWKRIRFSGISTFREQAGWQRTLVLGSDNRLAQTTLDAEKNLKILPSNIVVPSFVAEIVQNSTRDDNKRMFLKASDNGRIVFLAARKIPAGPIIIVYDANLDEWDILDGFSKHSIGLFNKNDLVLYELARDDHSITPTGRIVIYNVLSGQEIHLARTPDDEIIGINGNRLLLRSSTKIISATLNRRDGVLENEQTIADLPELQRAIYGIYISSH